MGCGPGSVRSLPDYSTWPLDGADADADADAGDEADLIAERRGAPG